MTRSKRLIVGVAVFILAVFMLRFPSLRAEDPKRRVFPSFSSFEKEWPVEAELVSGLCESKSEGEFVTSLSKLLMNYRVGLNLEFGDRWVVGHAYMLMDKPESQYWELLAPNDEILRLPRAPGIYCITKDGLKTNLDKKGMKDAVLFITWADRAMIVDMEKAVMVNVEYDHRQGGGAQSRPASRPS